MRSIIIVSSHTDINSIFHLGERFSLLERMNGLNGCVDELCHWWKSGEMNI